MGVKIMSQHSVIATIAGILLEGQQFEDTVAKHPAAKRWAVAVNHWDRLGRWISLTAVSRSG